ncbi:MAG: ribonuclease R, partial [Thermodesulfobacteriota bacterium]
MKTDKKNKVVEFMRQEAYRPLSIKELTRGLDVPGEARDGFKRLVKEMAAEGTLVKIRGNRYGLPSKMNLITGEMLCHPNGFGFVKPEEGGEDLFINPARLNGAMHGDRVVARVEGVKRDGRREGRIIRVLTRAHKTVVGRLEKGQRGFSVVVPSNEKIITDIIIPPGEAMDAEEGSVVVCEITRWPAKHLSPQGKVTKKLGNPEDPDVEVEVITRKYGLPQKFPPAVLKEVKAGPARVGADDIKGRVDLRGLKVFTIDGESAKDFDDAVAVERTGKGGYRLHVSIADVSHYVKEGTLLDAEARTRATSVYFPDRCIPMLPEALSNGICSLNPREPRLTLTAELDFDSKGKPVGKKLYESVIKSSERLTYTEVRKVLADRDEETREKYSHIVEAIETMEELARKLNTRRAEGGSIDFDLPEPEIIIDIEGRIEDIIRSERNIAHRIIEEFMLAANRAVAEEFTSRKLPALHRVHEEPDEDAIREFKEFIAAFGYRLEAKGPKGFQQIVKKVEGKPHERLVNHVLLRSMKRALYSAEEGGHFGLAFKDYTHFTSPIRRYPDLVIHRLVKLLLKKKYGKRERDRMAEALPPIASHSSERERNAMEAERELVDLKKAQFMADKVGERFEGFVSGVTSFGVFVELKEFFVEGLVHVSSLTDDYYLFDEKRHTLMGENTKRCFRPGTEVAVLVDRVDIARRRIDFSLDDEPRRERGGRGGR